MEGLTPKEAKIAKRVTRKLPPRIKKMVDGRIVITKTGDSLNLDKLGYWTWRQDREGKKWIQCGPYEWQIDRSQTLCAITAAARHIAFATPEELYAVYKYVDYTNPLMQKFCDGRRDPDAEYRRQVQQLLEKEQEGILKPGGLLGALAVFEYLGNKISFTPVNSPTVWHYDNETYMHLLSETKDMPYMIHKPAYLQRLLSRLAKIGLIEIEEHHEPKKRGRPVKIYSITSLGWKAHYKLLHLHKMLLQCEHVEKLKYHKVYAVGMFKLLKLVRYTISLQVLDHVLRHNLINTGLVMVWLHSYNRCYLPIPNVSGDTVYPYSNVVINDYGYSDLWMAENHRAASFPQAGRAHAVVTGDSGSAKGPPPQVPVDFGGLTVRPLGCIVKVTDSNR
jgi:DNA-binding PadR family transcriptional regulator